MVFAFLGGLVNAWLPPYSNCWVYFALHKLHPLYKLTNCSRRLSLFCFTLSSFFSIKSFVLCTNCSISVLLHRINFVVSFHNIAYYNHDKVINRYMCISLIIDYHIIWNMTACISLYICRDGKNLYILFLCSQLYVIMSRNIFHGNIYLRKKWMIVLHFVIYDTVCTILFKIVA